jgi:uncharacterized membrane protein YkvA (DUF1232 family)
MAATSRQTAAKALWVAVRGAHRPGAPSAMERLSAFPRMLRMGMSGRYPHLDKGRFGLSLLALVYIVSPVDFVPELFLPLIGLGDDAVVIAWLAGTIFSEVDAFLTWEEEQRAGMVKGEVIP